MWCGDVSPVPDIVPLAEGEEGGPDQVHPLHVHVHLTIENPL